MATSRKTAAKPVVKPDTKPTAQSTVKAPAQKAASNKAVQSNVAAKNAPTKASQAVNTKADKKSKPEKIKVVRDSFTIPKSEYAAISNLKKRALALGTEVKKSELIRAGLALLVATNDAAFSKALAQVPTLKTGRPGKA